MEELTFYILFGGITMFVGWFMLIFIMFVLAAFFNWANFPNKFKKASAFMALLYIYGAIGNEVWFRIFANKYYISKDPLTHFIPIIPFGDWTIDPGCGGHLLGSTTMGQMQIYWLLFAVPIWLVTLITVYTIFKKRPTNVST